MMTPETHSDAQSWLRNSPMRPAGLGAAGILLTTGGLVAIIPIALGAISHATTRSVRLGGVYQHLETHQHPFPFQLVAYLALAILGILPIVWAEIRLRDGIRNEIWSREQLQALKRLLTHRGTIAFASMPGIAFFALAVVTHEWRILAGWPGMLLPLQAIQRINSALRPPTPTRLKERITAQPLQSEHWGHVANLPTE
jgi:hypothetical protein